MIEIILSALADFGLIREDDKHHKRIKEKEKKDGINRPFQKYILQPSSIMVIVLMLVGLTSAFLFFNYQRSSGFTNKTKKEITAMSERMEEWKEKYGYYPKDMNALIGKSPIRLEWKKDAWHTEYKFEINTNGQGFKISSAGPDKLFGTEDDIESK